MRVSSKPALPWSMLSRPSVTATVCVCRTYCPAARLCALQKLTPSTLIVWVEGSSPSPMATVTL